MFNMIKRIFVFCCFILFINQINGVRRGCVNTGVLFTEKILQSSIVVYGESLGKRIYVDTDNELLFNVTFRIDCIFKGESIDNRIEITDAGIKIDRTACQWLDPGKFYVVFLEKCGLNGSLYCPADTQERLVDDLTYELLKKTCYLKRIQPLNSLTNHCPNVSMIEFCPTDEMNIKIMPKGKNLNENEDKNMKITFDNLNQISLNNISKNQSSRNQIADNPYSNTAVLLYIILE